ncbi:MAG: Ig-like domain-containing protein, partial [Mycobacterium sp.]|nr:Ig-like domain-containing protein [Mycobacterium sp.]
MTPQPAVAVAAVAQPAAAVSGVSSLAGVVPSGNGNQAPTGPLNFVTAALSLISREINRLLFNSGPTAKPVLTSQTNALAGSIGGSDPEGDPLSYAIAAAPTHGSVVVDSAGNFTYTVDESLDATGGQDTFVVEVRDTGAGTARRFSASLSVAGPAPAATLPSSSPSVSYSVGDNWGSGFIGTMN